MVSPAQRRLAERRAPADRRNGEDRRQGERRESVTLMKVERRSAADRRQNGERRQAERRAGKERRTEEQVAEHIRNALQLLTHLAESGRLDDEARRDLDAAMFRLRFALERLERGGGPS